jgi:hypothetical protein
LALDGAVASSSQAALFHSETTETTLTVKTDGTNNTKQAHQVIDLAGATLTCGGISGHGITKDATPTSITVDVTYDEPCTFVGQPATVHMQACNYTITSHGTVSITERSGAPNTCSTEQIKISVPSPPCVVTIGQTGNQNLESVTFKNIGSVPTREITFEPHVTGITYTAHGSGCPEVGPKTNGNYTTGNFLLTGEKVGTATHVGVWWE